jgi:hypothetical protein
MSKVIKVSKNQTALLEKINFFKFDTPNLRKDRQIDTWNKVAKLLEKGVSSKQEIKPYINETKLTEVLPQCRIEEKTLFEKCKGDFLMSMSIATSISKESHRQSGQDEVYTLTGIHNVVKDYGFTVDCLTNSAKRPANDGNIYSSKEYKKIFGNNLKDYKTIDGNILLNDSLIAYISHKYCLGKGGGQDNVFHEQKKWLEWGRNTSKRKDLIYIALIDTNLEKEFEYLKSEFDTPDGNIWVVNHVELQKRLILSTLT